MKTNEKIITKTHNKINTSIEMKKKEILNKKKTYKNKHMKYAYVHTYVCM